MSFGYYIWYRVRADERETETVIRHMMARLACRAGVTGRLLKKREEPRLWMEIYEEVGDPAAFERLLAAAVDEFDVEMFCEDSRHSECFTQADEVVAACRAG
ncbi:MAG: DUF4936 family protein [Gallionellaceae bacterium]|nr:DUF4936 family protein [Gallionellaceae bacterium]